MGLTRYYRDTAGNYIGGFDVPPPQGIEVPKAPETASQKWDSTNNKWLPKEN